MRIALRPSGGRGDYELAGSYNQLHASDLLGKRFFFQITPVLVIDGRAYAKRLSGKPRIRPEEGGKHAYVLIASILLLPPPRRELIKTSMDFPELRANAYTMSGIDVDVLEDTPTRVTFAPKSIWARSRGGFLKVDYVDRIAIISALWSVAGSHRSPLSKMMKTHRASIEEGNHARIVESAITIQKHYQTDTDILPSIWRDFGLPYSTELAYTGISTSTEDPDIEDDSTSPEESQRDRVRKWRKQVDRGPGAREFSIRVREAYKYRCLFSGERFPKFLFLDSAGVDGAHILPWSTHQLNSVTNGLCLCKLCHWAFDNGLLRLDYDTQSSNYIVSIPSNIEQAAIPAGFDLSHFQRYSGRIDPSRLPANRKLWPSAAHIRHLNARL